MSRMGQRLLVRDQFTQIAKSPFGTYSDPAWSELALVATATIPAALVFVFSVKIPVLSGLLTATSILTGLTFTMALRFWERSIDARTNAGTLADGPRLQVLDKMRAHLVWTVLVGVAGTAFLALGVIFTATTPSVWLSAVAAFLVIYQVLLVGGALLRFYELAYVLRP